MYACGRENIKDAELGFKPDPGYQWTIDKKRYDYLNGGNPKKAIFVKLIKIIPPEEEDKEMQI
jgi:hypothetical protein